MHELVARVEQCVRTRGLAVEILQSFDYELELRTRMPIFQAEAGLDRGALGRVAEVHSAGRLAAAGLEHCRGVPGIFPKTRRQALLGPDE